MRRLLPLVLGVVSPWACGGKAAPAEKPTPEVSPVVKTRVPIEEDEDEGVTFVNSRGRMDPKAIEVGLAPHTQAMADCYMTNVGRRRWLGGHVVLHWEIKADGTITAVRLAESDLGNWPIEKCLLEVARAATFEKPTGGDADFQLPLDFTAKGASVPWDEDKALRAVGGQVGKLATCAKGKVPAPMGVVVTVYVGPGGKAQSVGFSGASVIDDAWADCAEKAAMAWRLPDPRGTVAKLAVKYPRE